MSKLHTTLAGAPYGYYLRFVQPTNDLTVTEEVIAYVGPYDSGCAAHLAPAGWNNPDVVRHEGGVE